ncbi:hypothetical protein [Vibrio splendidus]|uniref:hypothetical protein n=1 Tax=Vibrio splendidus TaxID=29497 RepID=UPI00076A398F|nr:hypothetical protein [Vibrio splendidus]OCH67816.1 hypothetical protein A6D94_07170 [Vibrio splendidus]PHX05158.1 hypothetical protein VSPL_34880 [Vibrio splendidus]
MGTKVKAYTVLVIALLVQSCASIPDIEYSQQQPSSSDITTISAIYSHAWSPIHGYGEETEGFAAYSYVISTKSPDLLETYHPEAYKKLGILLAEIKGSPIPLNDFLGRDGEHSELIAGINLFLIPENRQNGNYSVGLSQLIVARIARQLEGNSEAAIMVKSLLDNPGPFIVTAPVRISDIHKGDEVVFVFLDMSKINPQAISELINSYASWLKSDAPSNIDTVAEFYDRRIALLSFMQDFSDSITLVNSSLAAYGIE